MNSGQDTHRATAIDITRDIVATIDIIHISLQYTNAGCITTRDVVRIVTRIQLDILIRNRCSVAVECTHISLTATTIDIIHYHSFAIHLQQQAFRTRHSSLVTTTVEHTYLTSLQIPTGTDSHVSLVVTAKQTTNLEGFAIGVCEGGIDSHLLEAIVGQQLAASASVWISCIYNTADHLTGVIQTDDGLVGHRGVVTTTVGINDRTAKNFQVGLSELGR